MISVLSTPTSEAFFSLLGQCTSSVFLCSPFIKEPVANRIIKTVKPSVDIQVLSRCRLDTFASEASDLSAIRKLVDHHIGVASDPLLHAKVYVFDDKKAILGSANLTPSGLSHNDEISLLFDDEATIRTLKGQFDYLLGRSSILSSFDLDYFAENLDRVRPLVSDGEAENLPLGYGDILSSLSGWEQDVFRFLNGLNHRFSLEEAYGGEAMLSALHPDNHHIKDKIRQVLQYLRNKGLISFLGRGQYQRLWL